MTVTLQMLLKVLLGLLSSIAWAIMLVFSVSGIVQFAKEQGLSLAWGLAPFALLILGEVGYNIVRDWHKIVKQ